MSLHKSNKIERIKRFDEKLRKQVKESGLQHFMELHRVQNPEQLMLNCIFNLLHGIAEKQCKDENDHHSLTVQRAIFDLAAQSKSMFVSLNKN